MPTPSEFAPSPFNVFPANLEGNWVALAQVCSSAGELLRDAQPPAMLSQTAGRDGSPNFCWRGQDGRLVWLGRTTMPAVRAAALLEAFQPGTRNVLLYGFGEGSEVQSLLRRLAPHQAVFVVEETAWAANLVLRLHDFAEDLRLGRLLIFAGPDAWRQLENFFLTHDGFLTPERVLAWPWFDAATIAAVSDRLSAIAGGVAKQRAERHAESRRTRAARGSSAVVSADLIATVTEPTRVELVRLLNDRPKRNGAADVQAEAPVLALLSNLPERRIRNTAAKIRAAAKSLGWPCVSFVLDDPASVHPYAVEAALWDARPSLLVLVETLPGAMQIELPPAARCVLCAHGLPLAGEWLRQVPSDTVLGVMTRRQADQAKTAGLDGSRIVVLPPAAQVCFDRLAGAQAGMRILIVAEGHDPSAEAVGLHLASHCKLWDAAAQVIRERCESYGDEDAEAVLAEAQRRLRIKLDSPDVRQGLATRIRQVLGPVLVRQACCTALAEAGIEFELYGGWEHDAVLSPYHRGLWPSPGAVARVLIGGGAIVTIEPSGAVHSALLDGIAAGLAGVVRAHPLDDDSDGLAGVLDPREHVWRFTRPSELVQLLRRFQTQSDDFRLRSAAAAAHINAHHTWACRLDSLVEKCIPLQ